MISLLVIIHSSAHYSDNPIHYHSLKRPYILIFVRQGVRWPANAVFQEKERENKHNPRIRTCLQAVDARWSYSAKLLHATVFQ